MHVSVVIPTLDRLKLLQRTIKSLRASTYKDMSIVVVVDGNPKLLKAVRRMPVDTVMWNEKRQDWIRSMNRALTSINEGAVVYASDDLEFEPRCIEYAAKRLIRKTPKGDGLVAITQDVKGCSTAFGLLGRAFIERFPQRAVFCPDYIHYCSDAELGRFTRSIGRLFMCDEARVTHHRPKDNTYRTAKPAEQRDLGYQRMRIAEGLVWGKSFKLLSKRGRDALT